MNLQRLISGLCPAMCREYFYCPLNIKEIIKTTASIPVAQQRSLASKPPKIDKSRMPELREGDLEEKFILGWGPGGQCINKTASAVYLRHIPTGLFVKCQKHRGQHKNRAEARALLQEKVDEVLNGEDSVVAQRQRLLEVKSAKRANKTKKRRQMQAEWKESLKDNANDHETLSPDIDNDRCDKS